MKRWAERTNGGATSSSSEMDLVRHTAVMLGSLQQRNGRARQILPATSYNALRTIVSGVEWHLVTR
jgi:hypothetical protein